MRRIKRRWILLSIAVIGVGGGIVMYGRDVESHSLAQDISERQRLAQEHTHCSGFYLVMMSSIRKDNPDYSELQKTYRNEFDRHAEMGLKLSTERGKFKSQIEAVVSEFSQEIITATKKEQVVFLVENGMRDCVRTLFQTADFVNRVPKNRFSDTQPFQE